VIPVENFDSINLPDGYWEVQKGGVNKTYLVKPLCT